MKGKIFYASDDSVNLTSTSDIAVYYEDCFMECDVYYVKVPFGKILDKYDKSFLRKTYCIYYKNSMQRH